AVIPLCWIPVLLMRHEEGRSLLDQSAQRFCYEELQYRVLLSPKMDDEFVFAQSQELDVVDGSIPILSRTGGQVSRVRKFSIERVDRAFRTNCYFRFSANRDGHARHDIYIQQTFFEEHIANTVLIIGPTKFEGIGNSVMLGICGPQRDRCLRLTPGAAARSLFGTLPS